VKSDSTMPYSRPPLCLMGFLFAFTFTILSQ
jgi:hypothetical protein